jgi:hypothetical protein
MEPDIDQIKKHSQWIRHICAARLATHRKLPQGDNAMLMVRDIGEGDKSQGAEAQSQGS